MKNEMIKQEALSASPEEVQLSTEQIAMITEAELEYVQGKSHTFEEVMENARKKVNAWLPTLSA